MLRLYFGYRGYDKIHLMCFLFFDVATRKFKILQELAFVARILFLLDSAGEKHYPLLFVEFLPLFFSCP